MGVPRGVRAWPAWAAPLAFAERPAGWLVAAGLAMPVAATTVIDLASPGDRTVGAVTFLAMIAGGWLLGPGPLTALVAAALGLRAAPILAGSAHPATLAIQLAVLPLMALVSRFAALNSRLAHANAARAALVLEVSRIASSARSLGEILRSVLGVMARHGLRGGSIALIDEENRLYIAAAEGTVSPGVMAARLPVGEGVMGQVASSGRSLLVADLQADGPAASPLTTLGSNREIRALIAAPLVSGGRTIGVMELDSPTPNRFTSDDLAVLEQVALGITGAVQRAGALQLADENLRQRLREMGVLLEAARTLAATLDLDTILQLAARAAAEVVLTGRPGTRRASIARVEDGMAIVAADFDEFGHSLVGTHLPLEEHPGLRAAYEEGRASAVTSAQLAGSAARRARAAGVVTGASAPIRTGSGAWGVLTVASRSQHQFTEAELRLLAGVADLTGLAIGNAENLHLERLRAIQFEEHGRRMQGLDQVKSEFLRLASHELRGPLAVVRGYLSLLQDRSLGELPAPAEAVLPVLAAKLSEMNLMIDQMLETARLDDERLSLQVAPLDLRHAIQAALGAATIAGLPLHRIVFQPPSAPVRVLADGDRVGTILSNLLDNAIKYSPEGGPIRIRLSVRGGVARLAVTDRGLGIAAEDMPRLFTRFGRLVTSANSHIPGTGLGLYLSRELARMHGGDIRVRTAAGRGSTFTLELPLAEAGSAELGAAGRSAERGGLESGRASA